MTNSDAVFHSPIAPGDSTDNVQVADGPGSLLRDLTGVPVILIQGEADDVVQEHFGGVPVRPGDVTEVGDGLLVRLTPTEHLLFGRTPGVELPPVTELDTWFATAGRFAHATDTTHGQAVVRLSGSSSRELLSKVCGLDFGEGRFPHLHAAQTRAAKVNALIVRYDTQDQLGFFLLVSRALGQYFWEVVWDAGQESGIGTAPST